MRIGASTLGFRHDSLDVALDAIEEIGFDDVDLGVISSYCPHFDVLGADQAAVDALERQVKDRGFRAATLNTGEGALGDPKSQDRAMEGMEKALAIGAQLGCYAITVPSGPVPENVGLTFAELCRNVTPLWRQVCDRAAALGIDIAIEIHKQALAHNTQTALDLAEAVNHPALGFTLDPSHIVHAGEVSDRAARALGKLVRHVHLRDAIGQDIMVVPGDGTVDFGALKLALDDIGYDRVCTIELEYEEARAPQVQPDLARSKTLLKSIWT